MLKRMAGYVSKNNFFGEVITIDFENNKIVLENEDKERHSFPLEDTEIMEEAFEMHDVIVYDKDVIQDMNLGDKYLVKLHDDGRVSLDKLNDNLKVVSKGDKLNEVTKEFIDKMEMETTLVGNIYQLRSELFKDLSFNFDVIKSFNGKHYVYYFALNDKNTKQIDLVDIAVLLDNKDYRRITVTYDYFTEALSAGVFKKVSEDELDNYSLGLTYNKDNMNVKGNKFKKICGMNYGYKLLYEEKSESLKHPKKDNNKKCKFCGDKSEECYCHLWD